MERERMFTIAVNKAGFEGVYKGAGTKAEVYQDMENLKSKGIKSGEMKVLPIIGNPRTKVVEKTIYVECETNEDDEFRNSVSSSGISTGTALAAGAVAGAAITVGAVIVYKKLKKKDKK